MKVLNRFEKCTCRVEVSVRVPQKLPTFDKEILPNFDVL